MFVGLTVHQSPLGCDTCMSSRLLHGLIFFSIQNATLTLQRWHLYFQAQASCLAPSEGTCWGWQAITLQACSCAAVRPGLMVSKQCEQLTSPARLWQYQRRSEQAGWLLRAGGVHQSVRSLIMPFCVHDDWIIDDQKRYALWGLCPGWQPKAPWWSLDGLLCCNPDATLDQLLRTYACSGLQPHAGGFISTYTYMPYPKLPILLLSACSAGEDV
jgi:hypothetical protein